MLIEKISILKKEKVRLDKEIFAFDSKNKEKTDQIEQLEIKITNLQKQKKAKKFLWFSNFNKEITEQIIKIKDLSETIDENEKNAQPLKVSKLNILKEMIDLQNDLYQEQVKKYQEIFQNLDEIAENQPFKIADESSYRLSQNPFDEEERTDILRAKFDELENKILTFEEKNKEITIQIETFENNINVLREEKTKTNWKITCLNIITFGFFKYHRNKKINEEIKALQIEVKTLRKKLEKNEKETRPLKNSQLNTMEDIIDLQDSMFIKIKMQKEEKLIKSLTAIVENQRIAEFDETNPFSAKTVPMSRYSSKDSGFSSETTQSNSTTNSLNPFDEENDIDDLSSSLVSTCNEEVVANDSTQTYMPVAVL